MDFNLLNENKQITHQESTFCNGTSYIAAQQVDNSERESVTCDEKPNTDGAFYAPLVIKENDSSDVLNVCKILFTYDSWFIPRPLDPTYANYPLKLPFDLQDYQDNQLNVYQEHYQQKTHYHEYNQQNLQDCHQQDDAYQRNHLESLQDPEESQHQLEEPTTNSPLLKKMNTCGQGYENDELNFHLLTHMEKETYSCSACNKEFREKSELRQHLCVHSETKIYSCAICNKEFSRQNELSMHLKRHSTETNFSCSICGKCFPLRHRLTKHIKTHSLEKPFSCPICKKSFRDKHHMNRHFKNHSGERPFSCSTCGKSFQQRTYLTQHERSHTRPFTCEDCGKTFARKSSLSKHFLKGQCSVQQSEE